MSEEMAYDMFFGITVIELRCEHCGDVTSRRLVGDARQG